MKPKKHLIDRAVADGSMDRLNQLFSASHILLCEANGLVAEAGLLLGELKQLHTAFTRSADRYFREFAAMVTTDKQKMDMFRDMNGFDEYFRHWAKLPREWQLKQIEQPIKENEL